jgi:hypothetical protein
VSESESVRHTLLDRILGRHEWVEDYRTVGLFDIVYYGCAVCGEPKERWEYPDRGELSLDPKVRAEQKADRIEDARRLRERMRDRDV